MIICIISSIIVGLIVIRYCYLYIKLTKKVTQYPENIELDVRFSKEKMPKQVDYIIVGSGPGGLVSGALLSKLGKKVLVLEQHKVAGGTLHTFGKEGFVFDTGLHYLGNRSDWQSLLNLAISKPIEWNYISNYDTVRINNDPPFPLCAPEKDYYINLKKMFPEAKASIDQFRILKNRAMNLLSIVSTSALLLPNFLHNVVLSIVKVAYSDIFGKTTQQVFDKYGISKHKKLAIILQTQLGDCGNLPSTCPFIMNIGVLDHYCEGALYPVGGTHKISESLVHTIRHFGGTVLTKAAVTKILVEDGRAVGVEVCNQTIKCNNIISDAGIRMTLSLLPEAYRWQYPYSDSVSHFYCFVAIKGNYNFPTCNTWHFSVGEDLDLDKAMRQYRDKQDFNFLCTFTSFCSVKAKTPGDIHSCIIICEANPEWVLQYKETTKRRKEGYKEYKKKIQNMLVDRLISYYPEIKDNIIKVKVGTPLTNEYYLGRLASYGIEFTHERFISKDLAKSKTPIKGLHLTGEDMTSIGVASAIGAGFLTALRVEKYFW